MTRRELLQAGVTRGEIAQRIADGSLIPVHRGVFRVGHCARSVEATYLAAVRACGDGAVLSGRAAAHLLGLVKGGPPRPEVTTRTQRRPRAVEVRRVRDIDRRDIAAHRGIPVTTVPRTLVDLAADLGAEDLGRACHEAGVRWGTTPADVEAVLERRPNAKGARKLRRILTGDEPITLSRLERRFLALLRDDGLPLPLTNRQKGGHRVDCRWPEHRLTVELDGYRYHRSRHAWERDRRREREARARGDDFRRYTYGDVYDEPASLLAELRVALAGT